MGKEFSFAVILSMFGIVGFMFVVKYQESKQRTCTPNFFTGETCRTRIYYPKDPKPKPSVVAQKVVSLPATRQ